MARQKDVLACGFFCSRDSCCGEGSGLILRFYVRGGSGDCGCHAVLAVVLSTALVSRHSSGGRYL